jgi:hypothetical protein
VQRAKCPEKAVRETIERCEAELDELGIEAGAETMEETDGPEGSGSGRCGTGLPQGSPEGPEEDMKDGAAVRGL